MQIRIMKGRFKNLDEFLQTGIKIKLYRREIGSILDTLKSYNSDIEALLPRIIMPESFEVIHDFEEVIADGFAVLSYCHMANYRISQSIARNNGTTPLLTLQDIIPEIRLSSGYILHKKLRILPVINRHLGILIHSGILYRWDGDLTKRFIEKSEKMRKEHLQPNLFLNDFDSIVLFYGCGILISSIVFTAEIFGYYLKYHKFLIQK